MALPEHYQPVRALERALGDPFVDGGDFSVARSVALDEEEAYPEAQHAALDAFGLPDHYVPTALGGRLDGLDVLLALLRSVARRNLATAVAHGKTFLGAVPVWVAGSDEQRRSLAARIRRGEQLGLAYHEREHGADLLATATRAEPTGDGAYLLSGEKWLINNATRGTVLTVLATAPKGLSLFLVDKQQQPAGALALTPRSHTAGVRGVDFSGVRLTRARVPGDALVGSEGGAVELTVRAFQITRSMIPSLSLGAVDSALRTTLRFAVARTRGDGGTVLDIPQAQALVTGAFADLLAGEALALAAARALHVFPGQGSVFSSASKYVVPQRSEGALWALGVVLGARGYLRREHDAGVYQKLVRDHGVVSIFHAGSYLNLNTITQQLRALALRAHDPDATARAALFDVARPAPPLAVQRLQLSNAGRDDVLAAAPSWPDRVRARVADGEVEPRAGQALVALVDELARRVPALDAAVRAAFADTAGDDGGHVAVEAAELAGAYATLFAAACALELWLACGRRLGSFVAAGDWLLLALSRLLAAPLSGARLGRELRARLAEELRFRLDAGVLFSLLPIGGEA